VNEPSEPASLVKLTVPPGVIAAGTSLSNTPTVQLVLEPICTGAGEQVTLVVVARRLTMKNAPVSLPSWLESPSYHDGWVHPDGQVCPTFPEPEQVEDVEL